MKSLLYKNKRHKYYIKMYSEKHETYDKYSSEISILLKNTLHDKNIDEVLDIIKCNNLTNAKQIFNFYNDNNKYPISNFFIGLMYLNGYYVDRDIINAETHLIRAEKSDLKYAQHYLGMFYYNGYDGNINYEKAIEYLYKAAKQGFIDSYYQLGIIHSNNTKNHLDYYKAYRYFTLASEENHTKSQDKIREMLNDKIIKTIIDSGKKIAEQEKLIDEQKKIIDNLKSISDDNTVISLMSYDDKVTELINKRHKIIELEERVVNLSNKLFEEQHKQHNNDFKNNDNIDDIKLVKIIKSIDYRPSWNSYFMVNAYWLSSRSSCNRLNVGCIIVRDNRSVSTGYNGHIKGAEHTSMVVDGHEQMTIHAEINAITDAAMRGVETKDTILYVTHYPCVNCAKSIISSGIIKVYYCENYKNSDICEKLYKAANIHIEQISL